MRSPGEVFTPLFARLGQRVKNVELFLHTFYEEKSLVGCRQPTNAGASPLTESSIRMMQGAIGRRCRAFRLQALRRLLPDAFRRRTGNLARARMTRATAGG